MLLNTIFIVVITICLVGISFIIGRQIKKIKILDIETVPQEQSNRAKDRILLERMKRSTSKSKDIIKKGTAPVWAGFLSSIKKLFNKIYDLEKKYQKEATSKTHLKGSELKNQIDKLLRETEKLLKDEKWSEAEKIFIEIVSLDPKNKPAYEGLIEVYLQTKEFKQALQTASFVLQLVKKKGELIDKENEAGEVYQVYSNANEIADAYVEFANIYKKMERNPEALQNYKLALEHEPNNPRNIDQALEMSIVIKDKSLALDLFKSLEQVNPENQKLKEYKEKIKIL